MKFPDDFIVNDAQPVTMPAPLAHLWRHKGYSVMSETQLLMLHRALCHKMLTTDPDLLGPEYDVRLKEVADEMVRRVIESGVELVP